MTTLSTGTTLQQLLYGREVALSGFLQLAGLSDSPVDITGDVGDPGTYNLPGLTPVTTETVTYQTGSGPVHDTYTGITLWNALTSAGGVDVTTAKNDILSKYVIATGADGYTVAFSLGEIDPSFGNDSVLVAYSDLAGELGPKGADGLARIIAPGDVAGGRDVFDLVSLRVGSLSEPAVAGPGGYSAQFTLSGLVAHPTTFTPITLAALGQSVTESATYLAGGKPVTDTYTGVSLWKLINDEGLLTDPAIKNDLLNYGVIATGSDGYRAIISLGEIDPAFGNKQDLVAYADTKGQLGTNGVDGATRLVLPGDVAGGRYVSNLVSLQVVNLTTLQQS